MRIDGAGAAQAGGIAVPERQGDAELGQDNFLQLLMTQLNNQDPLSPMDNSAFVEQLATFAQLEKLEGMSMNMETVAMSTTANTSAQMVGFIGRSVEVETDTVYVDGDSEPTMSFDLADEAATVEITITDEDGNVVRTMTVNGAEAGENEIAWDGKNNDGSPVPDGAYSIDVAATDVDGEPVAATTMVSRRVTGISYESGFPVLLLEGGGEARLGDVRNVIDDEHRASSANTNSNDEDS